MATENKIWDREGTDHDISSRMFLLIMTLFTIAGLAISGATASLSSGLVLSWPIAVGLIIVTLGAVVLTTISTFLPVKLIGYTLLTGLMGCLLGPVVALYTTASIFKVLVMTTGVVAISAAIGITYPKSLDGWHSYILGGLIILIVGQFGLIFFNWAGVAIEGALTFWEWAGVILFSFITIYDFNRAMRVERTVGNAVECAVNVYLDFVNIFIRLLSLSDKK